MSLGKIVRRMRALREARGLTQEQLAQKAGVSVGYIARLETERHDPKVSTLIKLAKALRVPVTDLLK
jgi:transcriptional regulator with XRE-family HTH domain